MVLERFAGMPRSALAEGRGARRFQEGEPMGPTQALATFDVRRLAETLSAPVPAR